MTSAERPVRFSKTHVRYALRFGVIVSVGLFVMFGVQDGFTVRLLISSAATTVLFIAGLTWSEWRADNRHERYMRRWRASRPKVPPKIR